MNKQCRKSTILAAALVAAVLGTPAAADGWPEGYEARAAHPPIFVRSPNTHHSVITPYYFGYHLGHYSYNSPGPVFRRMTYHGPSAGCRLWRYNYLYWIC